jgi:hypothetical protein
MTVSKGISLAITGNTGISVVWVYIINIKCDQYKDPTSRCLATLLELLLKLNFVVISYRELVQQLLSLPSSAQNVMKCLLLWHATS